MSDIYRAMKKAFKEGRPCVLATIVKQAGPAPRGVGAKCLIGEDGLLAGTIGGGLLEAKAVREAGKVLDTNVPAKLSFVLKGKDVEQTDMLCGGEAEVFIEPVVEEVYIPIFEHVATIEKRGGKAVVVTVLSLDFWDGGQIPKMLLSKEGEEVGSLHLSQKVKDRLNKELEKVMQSRRAEKMELVEDVSIEMFLEPVVSNPVLYIFGGGHVSRQIVPLASRVGFKVVVVDDRREFTKPEDLPGAAEVHQMPFDGVMEKFPVDEDSYLVIVTRGHVHDKNVLSQALTTNARYIGMIGSKRKRDIIYQKLLEQGFKQEDLERVHSPIGLEIGAETPEEIAVSIVAELIKVRAGVR
ncbi:MAG: XdhC/CoxI family protein [Deltaproteobacteria bacterium]|nr:MAG: XdhC/CoxI family protein [Deltaproteobacteria bacterium]